MSLRKLFGGIELGGTKTIIAIGHDDGTVIDSAVLPTIEPDLLFAEIGGFFRQRQAIHGVISGFGVGAFGPVVINPEALNFGFLLETPKKGWSGFDIISALKAFTDAPITLVTDVAAAGIGEAFMGALKDVELGLYLTVGTGIGGAILRHGAPLPALLHPELGHIALLRSSRDNVPSGCPFHENCAEGLAAGPAIRTRFDKPLSEFMREGDEVGLIADYLGQLCATLVFTLSPHRIVLGGGVMKTDGLLERTQSALLTHMNGYALTGQADSDFICAPLLGSNAGMIGALRCAATAKQS
jgi:fructokinase